MLSRFAIAGFLCLCILAPIGCDNPQPVDNTTPEAASGNVEELRTALQQVASTGEGGSSLMNLRPMVEAYAKDNPDKGDALMNDLQSLEQANQPERLKQIASGMLEKL